MVAMPSIASVGVVPLKKVAEAVRERETFKSVRYLPISLVCHFSDTQPSDMSLCFSPTIASTTPAVDSPAPN